jgi:hypothetical protein
MAQASLLWRLKNFNCHGHHGEGDKCFSITIRHAPTIGMQLNFLSHLKGKAMVVFPK